MKNKNILLILENHIDKIVLVVVSLLSLYLLGRYVVLNPYGIEVDGRKRSSANIDSYIKDKADRLNQKLDGPAPNRPYRSYLPEYKKLQQCPIAAVEGGSVLMESPGVGIKIEDDREYLLPAIPPLAQIRAAYLRGAAQIPIESDTDGEFYGTGQGELEDVDLITVSSRFDIQKLYNNFQQSFDGPRLRKTSWKDPRLAKPVFASMQLQRRSQQEDGTWGPWKTVPRIKHDSDRELLEGLPLILDESSFGVEDYWMPQFDQQDVQMNILQPEAHSFVISLLEWMPPEFLDESREIIEKQQQQARREAIEERRATERDTRRPGRPNRPTRPKPPRDRGARNNPLDMLGENTTEARARRTVQKERTVEDVKKDSTLALLTENSNLSTLQDPVLVWAHDEAAKPGGTYQYRIRLGVFNPIAGKDWFTKEEAAYKNQTVLWSAYSEPTEAISIPQRAYVFPLDVVTRRGSTDTIEAVEVEVMKYQMGRWHDYAFEIAPGQTIGHEVQVSDEEETMAAGGIYGLNSPQELRVVDFSTGWTLVDVDQQIVWDSRLRPKSLYQMLYCDEDQIIRQMAVSEKNWTTQTRKIRKEIQDEMEQTVDERQFENMDMDMQDLENEMMIYEEMGLY